MSYTLHEETVEAHGLKFKLTIEQDEDSRVPWKECDGFGPVREANKGYYERHVSKRAGERILHDGERNEYTWVYDWAEALKLAKKDGWGLSTDQRPTNWDTLTKGQQRVLAVQHTFDFLKAWCNEDWVWCGVCVELTGYHGPLDTERSLWSVEYWQYKALSDEKNSYVREIIDEMTEEIADRYHAEEAEKQACAERDIVTVE
jgi:hypothetical protein